MPSPFAWPPRTHLGIPADSPGTAFQDWGTKHVRQRSAAAYSVKQDVYPDACEAARIEVAKLLGQHMSCLFEQRQGQPVGQVRADEPLAAGPPQESRNPFVIGEYAG